MSIHLREITSDDIKTINVWRNDKKLIDQLGANFRYINLETDEQWFDQYMKNRSTQIRCAIIDDETLELIGVIYLLEIDFINRHGELSIFIGEMNNQNKGYGSLAVFKMLEHAFFNLNLHKVWIITLEKNIRAIRSYKKCGFVDDGTLRQHVYKNGKYENMKIMSIIKEEFIKIDHI